MMRNSLSVSIVVDYLKHYGVRKVVLSPGTRNIPFVAAVQADSFFECYSIVDERNAAFFALGLAQVSSEPVAISCTSGTAVSNYQSGLTEALYSNVPVVAITCDRSPYVLGQLETQKIDQIGALRSAVKCSYELPVLKSDDDVWYFERLLNEGMIEMRRSTPGPIHFNLPLVGETNEMWVGDCCRGFAVTRKYIDFVAREDSAKWVQKKTELLRFKKILVVMGHTYPGNEQLVSSIERFCVVLKVPLLADNLSNIKGESVVFAEAVVKGLTGRSFQKMLPDLVITCGMNFQERIKDLFKANRGKCLHWSVSPDGKIRDCFKSVTSVFESEPVDFFKKMTPDGRVAIRSDEYLLQWKTVEAAATLPVLQYGNFYVIREFCKQIPPHSLLHVGILNAARLTQFFRLPQDVAVYGNVNSFGIDGCLPTFMGQACQTTRPAFLLIGDISLFYALNALGIKHRSANVRILLINNGGAAEFHIPPSSNEMPSVDSFIAVAHDRTARGWAESLGYDYFSASDKDEFKGLLGRFVKTDNPRPVVFEVFTSKKRDGEFCLSVYQDLEDKVNGVIGEVMKDA